MAESGNLTEAATQAGQPRAASGEGPAQIAPAIATAILLMAILQVGLVMQGNAPVFEGILIDPDAYMRLARIERLWESGGWYDGHFDRINPPLGFELHWTRPLDVLLLAGAWAASHFAGFHTGLYWWGVALGPVLQVLSVCALIWAAAPLLCRKWRCLLAFLFVPQPGLFGMFISGRPDHHALLILLFILLIGMTLRLLRDPGREQPAIWAGLIAALAIWISVESILMVAVSIAALGLFWLLGEARFSRVLLRYAATLFLGLMAALLLERGLDDFYAADVDRISFAHLTVFALNLAFWFGLNAVERRGFLPRHLPWRVVASGAAGALALTLLWSLQPGLFADPLSNGDPLYLTKHLANIEELQPLIDFAKPLAGPWYEAGIKPLLWLGILVLAGPWLFYCLIVTRGAARRMWGFIGLGTLLFVPLTVAQLRWVYYPEIFLLLPYAALAGTLVDRVASRWPAPAVGLARPLLITAFCMWFFLPSLLLEKDSGGQAAVKTAQHCPLKTLAAVLNDSAGLGAAPKHILALIDFGPELLYRTRHSVFAIPNHRLQPGFTASYRIMSARNFDTAQSLLRTSGADLVLICPGSAEDWFYKDGDPGAGEEGSSLYDALRADEAPDFLTAVPLPGDLAQQFKLFSFRPVSD